MSGNRAAEHLRVLLDLALGLPHVRPEEVIPELDVWDLYIVEELTEEDLHLANACIEVESGLHSRQFAAVERLLSQGLFSGQDATAHLAELPPAAKGQAAYDLLFLSLVPGTAI
jgi:hypothetical protein